MLEPVFGVLRKSELSLSFLGLSPKFYPKKVRPIKVVAGQDKAVLFREKGEAKTSFQSDMILQEAEELC